jgi:hypothetical protein
MVRLASHGRTDVVQQAVQRRALWLPRVEHRQCDGVGQNHDNDNQLEVAAGRDANGGAAGQNVAGIVWKVNQMLGHVLARANTLWQGKAGSPGCPRDVQLMARQNVTAVAIEHVLKRQVCLTGHMQAAGYPGSQS